jgi:hypothetical protein
MTKRDIWLAVALSVGIGLIEPYVELAWKCRAGLEQSEACVWGRAYFRAAQLATLLILTPLLFGSWWVLAKLFSRR